MLTTQYDIVSQYFIVTCNIYKLILKSFINYCFFVIRGHGTKSKNNNVNNKQYDL